MQAISPTHPLNDKIIHTPIGFSKNCDFGVLPLPRGLLVQPAGMRGAGQGCAGVAITLHTVAAAVPLGQAHDARAAVFHTETFEHLFLAVGALEAFGFVLARQEVIVVKLLGYVHCSVKVNLTFFGHFRVGTSEAPAVEEVVLQGRRLGCSESVRLKVADVRLLFSEQRSLQRNVLALGGRIFLLIFLLSLGRR